MGMWRYRFNIYYTWNTYKKMYTYVSTYTKRIYILVKEHVRGGAVEFPIMLWEDVFKPLAGVNCV